MAEDNNALIGILPKTPNPALKKLDRSRNFSRGTFSKDGKTVTGRWQWPEGDDLWEKLSEGGEKGQCGWLKDKSGIS